MSWIDSISSSGYGWVGTAAGVILSAYILNRASKSGKGNDANNPLDTNQPDYGNRIQSEASTKNKIPVVYGDAILGGKMFEIKQSTDLQTMTYALALCERTGTMISGQQSEIHLRNVYWDNQRIVFKNDGVTVDYTVDSNGKVSRNLSGLVKIYFFNNGSNAPALPRRNNSLEPVVATTTTTETVGFVTTKTEVSYSTQGGVTTITTTITETTKSVDGEGNALPDVVEVTTSSTTGGSYPLEPAYNIIPTWDNTYTADEIVFAVVQVTYNKEKGVTGIGTLQFQLSNTMNQPGDCLKDYMTNTRYGASIDPEDIYVS